jgi:hypothetical protein
MINQLIHVWVDLFSAASGGAMNSNRLSLCLFFVTID